MEDLAIIGFGPISDPEAMLLYTDVQSAGIASLRISAMCHGDLTQRAWFVVLNGTVVGSMVLTPLVENSIIVPKPDTTHIHVAVLPLGHTYRAADEWFNDSAKAIIEWPAVAADSYLIYSDAGLGGAVSTLLATVDGSQTSYTTDELSVGNYVFNVIPSNAGLLAAPVDDASHVDILHTVTAPIGPPTDVVIAGITKPASPYIYSITWSPSTTVGATYEYQYSFGTNPDAINPHDPALWTACTSPLSLSVAGTEGDLLLVQIRSVSGGDYGFGPVLHSYIPATTQLLIPIDAPPVVRAVEQDGSDIIVKTSLSVVANMGNTTIDLEYSDTLAGPYTLSSAWATGVVPKSKVLLDGQTGYFHTKQGVLSGLTQDSPYFIRCRYRSSTHISNWSKSANMYLKSTPALATPNPTTRGA